MSQEVTILLIEDEPEIRRFLRTTLPAHGFHIHEAATAHDGLTQAKAWNPDLILLDIGLPDFEGTEVIPRYGSGPQRPSSCCRHVTRNRRRWRPSISVPTTISPSRSE